METVSSRTSSSNLNHTAADKRCSPGRSNRIAVTAEEEEEDAADTEQTVVKCEETPHLRTTLRSPGQMKRPFIVEKAPEREIKPVNGKKDSEEESPPKKQQIYTSQGAGIGVHTAGENGQLNTEKWICKAEENGHLHTEEWMLYSSQEEAETECNFEDASCETAHWSVIKRSPDQMMLKPADIKQESDEETSETEDDVDTDEDLKFFTPSDSCDESSEGGEDTEDAVDPSNKWKSKNGKILWSLTPAEALHLGPASSMSPGPTQYAVDRISTLKSCFDLFLTEEIMQLVLDMTNLQGKRSVKEWRHLDLTDLQAYIGLSILAGVYRSRNESTHSLWDDHTGRPIFRATMSHTKFNLINANLRFEDKYTPSVRLRHDSLGAIRILWDKWTEHLPCLFHPGQDVCVDEQLIPFRGRCGFRQFIPKKPAKYGMKIWVTCDVDTLYAWKMQIYTGGPADGLSKVDQGERIVLNMTEGLQGNTVTCNKFFTSYSLAEELLRQKITLVGTIRTTKPELPPQLLQSKQRPHRSSTFAYNKTHTLVSYKPRWGRDVVLLSTKHHEPSVSQEEHWKPTIMLDYNRCRRAVDSLDKVVGVYSCRRRSCRWPLALFFHILDISAYNAFVLWKSVNPSWNRSKTFTRRLFLEALGKVLVSPQMQRRDRLPRTAAAAAMVSELQHWTAPVESEEPAGIHRKGRRLCVFCTGKRKKTGCTCTKCGRHVCKVHAALYCRLCGT